MALEIKKVRYSSRYGYAVEWHEPASIRLSGKEALLLSVYNQNLHLDEDELNEQFDWEEREVIHRYHQRVFKNLQTALDEVEANPPSFKALEKAFKAASLWALETLGEDWGAFRDQHLGWKALEAKQVEANRAFKRALNQAGTTRYQFERLLNQYGKPTAKIMADVEKRLATLGGKQG